MRVVAWTLAHHRPWRDLGSAAPHQRGTWAAAAHRPQPLDRLLQLRGPGRKSLRRQGRPWTPRSAGVEVGLPWGWEGSRSPPALSAGTLRPRPPPATAPSPTVPAARAEHRAQTPSLTSSQHPRLRSLPPAQPTILKGHRMRRRGARARREGGRSGGGPKPEPFQAAAAHHSAPSGRSDAAGLEAERRGKGLGGCGKTETSARDLFGIRDSQS